MCLDCGKKACEIDARVPHFIDRYNAGLTKMSDLVYVPARDELWAYMKAKHGRIVKL